MGKKSERIKEIKRGRCRIKDKEVKRRAGVEKGKNGSTTP